MSTAQWRIRPLELDRDLRFTQPANMLAFDYWKARCAGRRMPTRGDLHPGAMRRFTEHIGLIEIRKDPPDAHPDYFIRRAGTAWEGVFGPITGRYIHEFLPPEIETRWRQVFESVRETAAPVRAATGIQFQRKTWLEAEMFVAPLGELEVAMLFLSFVSWSTKAGSSP